MGRAPVQPVECQGKQSSLNPQYAIALESELV